MVYTFVYRKDGVAKTSQFRLEVGVDLAEAIANSGKDLLSELDADKNSPLFAIVK